MPAAYYDFFRKIVLQPDNITLEADSTIDTLTITGGAGVALNPNATNDSFEIDVDYQLYVPIGTTEIRLNDVNSNYTGVTLSAGSNISIGRNSNNELTITSTVGGTSKAISNATQTNPVVITTTNIHSFTESIAVTITDVTGMTQLNGNEYYMDILTSTTFALYEDADLTTPLDGTGFSSYSSGGVATAEYNAPQSLTQLTDVDFVSNPPVNGSFLQYNGSYWGVGNTLDGDFIGSVFADDSTLLVDGVNGIIPKANIESSTNWDTAYDWGDHSTQSYLTSISGLNISDLINDSGYLTSYTETDPVVGAVTGIVKSDGAGNISAAVEGTDYLSSVAFGDLTSTPTTLLGYGITDAATSAQGALADSAVQQGDVLIGDLVGSVFGDDSTPIVDAINNRLIVAGVELQADPTLTTKTIQVNGSLHVLGDATDYYSYFEKGLVVRGFSSFTGPVQFTSNIASTPESSTTAGAVTIDWESSDTHFIEPTGAWTLSIINSPTVGDTMTLTTIIIRQGATPYFPSSISYNGVDVTSNTLWQNGGPPTPTAGGIDLLQIQSYIRESTSTRFTIAQMATYA